MTDWIDWSINVLAWASSLSDSNAVLGATILSGILFFWVFHYEPKKFFKELPGNVTRILLTGIVSVIGFGQFAFAIGYWLSPIYAKSFEEFFRPAQLPYIAVFLLLIGIAFYGCFRLRRDLRKDKPLDEGATKELSGFIASWWSVELFFLALIFLTNISRLEGNTPNVLNSTIDIFLRLTFSTVLFSLYLEAIAGNLITFSVLKGALKKLIEALNPRHIFSWKSGKYAAVCLMIFFVVLMPANITLTAQGSQNTIIQMTTPVLGYAGATPIFTGVSQSLFENYDAELRVVPTAIFYLKNNPQEKYSVVIGNKTVECNHANSEENSLKQNGIQMNVSGKACVISGRYFSKISVRYEYQRPYQVNNTNDLEKIGFGLDYTVFETGSLKSSQISFNDSIVNGKQSKIEWTLSFPDKADWPNGCTLSKYTAVRIFEDGSTVEVNQYDLSVQMLGPNNFTTILSPQQVIQNNNGPAKISRSGRYLLVYKCPKNTAG